MNKTTPKTPLEKAKRVWYGMKNRCYNRKCQRFKYYGARGITVCPEWINDFEQFLKDMGTPPVGKSLGRRDNNKPYSKNNCRWETQFEQMRSTSRNKKIIAYKNGKEFKRFNNAKDASIELKCNYTAILHIVNKTGVPSRRSSGGYTFATHNDKNIQDI
jgi:hypothetical protein